jgi:hypothetical protein
MTPWRSMVRDHPCPPTIMPAMSDLFARGADAQRARLDQREREAAAHAARVAAWHRWLAPELARQATERLQKVLALDQPPDVAWQWDREPYFDQAGTQSVRLAGSYARLAFVVDLQFCGKDFKVPAGEDTEFTGLPHVGVTATRRCGHSTGVAPVATVADIGRLFTVNGVPIEDAGGWGPCDRCASYWTPSVYGR